MKKILFITVLALIFTVWAYAQAPSRTLTQEIRLDPTHTGAIYDYVTADSPNHTTDYFYSVHNVTQNETRSNATHGASLIRVCRLGGRAVASVNQSIFPAAWPIGSTLILSLTYIPTGETATYDVIVPTGTASWSRIDANAWVGVPPFPVIPTDYTVTVTSAPAGVPIHINGIPTENSTPWVFTLPAGFTGSFSVVWPGYTWNPATFPINNLQANANVHFVGTPTIVNPPPAIPMYPLPGAVINWAWNAPDGPIMLAWMPDAGPTPEGYKLWWNDAAVPINLPAGTLSWMTPVLGVGTYVWKIVPYITDPVAPGGKRILAPVAARIAPNTRSAQASPKGDAQGCVYWAFEINRDAPPPIYWNVAVTSNPVGAMIHVNGNPTEHFTPHTFSMLQDTSATYSVMMVDYTWLPLEYVVTNIMENHTAHFVGTPDVPPGDYDFEEGVPTPFLTVTITLTGGPADNVPGGIIPGFPNPGFVADEEFVLHLYGAGPWVITIATASPWGAYYQSGSWHAVANIGGFITFEITAAKDIPLLPFILGPVDPTLPVELSGFYASLTAQYFVKLTWISHSETGLLGYRVYRSESSNQAGALMITPVMVPATNTSTTQTYSITDSEVSIGSTYWYWLESVDYNSSNFHGPVSVTVEGSVPPVLPEATTLRNAYPNPFKSNSNVNIGVEIKAGENGTITIYNILGQAVKTFSVNEGVHNINWNGKDSKGNACGSGIYFYKLSTPSMNQTKKMVIVK